MKEELKLDFDVYQKNEVDANKGLAKGCIITGIIIFFVWFGYIFKLFQVSHKTLLVLNIFFPIIILVLVSSFIYTKTKIVEKKYFKYFLIMQYILVVFVLNILIPKHVIIMWAVCIVLVNHYYNPKTSLFTFITVSVLMLVALYLAMLFGEWDNNLLNGADKINVYGKEVICDKATLKERLDWLKIRKREGDNRYLKVFLYYYVSRFLTLSILANVCYGLSTRNKRLLILEADSARNKQRLQTEFAFANGIQQHVLPNPIEKTSSLEICGLMNPAKDVGGDFYNYFYIDENHLAIVIADVSGKGIPAALLMMKTETLIKSLTNTLKNNTAMILSRCNVELCYNNFLNMFVTCWLGILDLLTGELKFTNAGHTPPLIYQNGEVKVLESKRGLVLGVMDSFIYTEETLKLKTNDKILLYTDGVTEAHNNDNNLYGEDRLLKFTKENILKEPKDFVPLLRSDIDTFANGHEQFDDITIMEIEFLKEATIVESRVFKADVKELDSLFNYSSSLLKILNFNNRDIIMINTALEEVFVNVCQYAYKGIGSVEVTLSNNKDSVTFIFKDSGVKFNPLEREDPNISAKSDEREIGGLGIYMVKKIMDEVKYEYVDGKNILTLVKKRIKK